MDIREVIYEIETQLDINLDDLDKEDKTGYRILHSILEDYNKSIRSQIREDMEIIIENI